MMVDAVPDEGTRNDGRNVRILPLIYTTCCHFGGNKPVSVSMRLLWLEHVSVLTSWNVSVIFPGALPDHNSLG